VSPPRTGDIPSPCDGVHVPSGASIQSAIDGNAAGTTFCLTGRYVLSSPLVAKTGDRFIGPATIDGQYTTPQAFAGRDRTIKNVTLRGLTVQHFNPAPQRAALAEAPGTGWVIDSNDVSFNSTGGIEVWTGGVVTGNRVHDNGQLGIRGFQSTGSLVTKNEVYRNNVVVAGFPTSGTFGQAWESGGMKFAKTTNLTISNNNVHDNIGNAIWLDTDDVGYMVKNNVVSNNSHHGIFIEFDQAGTVADNVVSKSGFLPPSPYGGAGMRVAGSTGVTMTGNSVTCSQGGNYSYINGSTVIDGGGNTSHGC
jgi:parallel beta-helix repeat protein